jgi:hypothetical protein
MTLLLEGWAVSRLDGRTPTGDLAAGLTLALILVVLFDRAKAYFEDTAISCAEVRRTSVFFE